MIEVKGLTKQYGSVTAVDHLNFKIYNGKIYGFLGPNGAGKSTTLNMLAGALPPTSGSININGFDLLREPLKAKQCIGYLPEIPPLYGELTPAEYLRFVADAKGLSYERGLRQIREAMELTLIDDRKNSLIKNLSKGYRQRVGIAQTLIGSPDIIILDEPTVGLDPRQLTEIRALIRQLGELQKTVLISSHILAEISETCDHVFILSNGKLVANAPPAELQAQNNGTVRIKLSVRGDEEGVSEALTAIESIRHCGKEKSEEAGVVTLILTAAADDDKLRDRIFFSMADRRYAVLSMEREEATLESVFLSLTQDNGTPAAKRASKRRQSRREEPERDGEYELIDTEKEEKR